MTLLVGSRHGRAWPGHLRATDHFPAALPGRHALDNGDLPLMMPRDVGFPHTCPGDGTACDRIRLFVSQCPDPEAAGRFRGRQVPLRASRSYARGVARKPVVVRMEPANLLEHDRHL